MRKKGAARFIALLSAASMVFTAASAAAFAEEPAKVCTYGGAEYSTIAAALDVVGEDGTGTITLMSDVTEDVRIGSSQDITIDLAGFTLQDDGREKVQDRTGNYKATIVNEGRLTILDSSMEGKGTVGSSYKSCAVVSNDIGAVCTIKSGTFKNVLKGSVTAYYTICNEGTMTIDGGIFVNTSTTSSMIETGFAKGKAENPYELTAALTINGGTFTGGGYNVKCDDYGDLTINGGTFSNTVDDRGCILVWNTTTITGGNFTASNVVIGEASNGTSEPSMEAGTVTVTGGNFTSDKGIIFAASGGVTQEIIESLITVSGGNYTDGSGSKVDVNVYLTEGCIQEEDGTIREDAPAPKPDQSGTGSGGAAHPLPVINVDAGAEAALNAAGSVAVITLKDGYEIADVILNGVSLGAVTEIMGLKSGDVVTVMTKVIADDDTGDAGDDADDNARLIEAIRSVRLAVRTEKSKAGGKKAIKVSWYAKDGTDLKSLELDGYQVYRSLKRYSGFGTKPIFTTKKTRYWNTAIRTGTRYYYKVRGYKKVDGVRYFTGWSLKGWRTA